jgi:hypothetical protein
MYVDQLSLKLHARNDSREPLIHLSFVALQYWVIGQKECLLGLV